MSLTNWFTPYLSDRTQRVAVNGGLSDNFRLAQGVRKFMPWPASVHGIHQRTIRYRGSTLAKRALFRR